MLSGPENPSQQAMQGCPPISGKGVLREGWGRRLAGKVTVQSHGESWTTAVSSRRMGPQGRGDQGRWSRAWCPQTSCLPLLRTEEAAVWGHRISRSVFIPAPMFTEHLPYVRQVFQKDLNPCPSNPQVQASCELQRSGHNIYGLLHLERNREHILHETVGMFLGKEY